MTINLESIYGIDLSFDARPGVRGAKDVLPNLDDTDFAYVSGPQALAQELQRLFDLTDPGSFIDDPTYGIKFPIGEPNDPRITVALTKVAVLRALQHPSFGDRFRVRYLEVNFDPQISNALQVGGILECFGFEGIEYARFGPYALKSF